eukprot:7389111-Prymnesium_polylepis.1
MSLPVSSIADATTRVNAMMISASKSKNNENLRGAFGFLYHCAEALQGFIGEVPAEQHILYIGYANERRTEADGGGQTGWSFQAIQRRFGRPDLGYTRDGVLANLEQPTEDNAARNRSKIEKAHTVFIGGGTPSKLLDRLEALGPLLELLMNRIMSGHTKLVCVSAGTVGASKTLSTANDGRVEGRAALGVLPFHIQPHWEGSSELDSARRDRTVACHGSVLSLDNDVWAIVHRGRVSIYGKPRASGLLWRNIGANPPASGEPLSGADAGGNPEQRAA